MKDIIIPGDCLESMKAMESESVHCIVTSPPYYGLRDYGMAGQLGLEETPEQFIQNMVEVFRDARRVLRDDGTLWLNIGDSYAHGKVKLPQERNQASYNDLHFSQRQSALRAPGLKPKDLIGIPWMLAFALRADGWYLRQDIIWHKPNPMPESVTDRCTKSHEYIFLLSKSPRYYYDKDAIMQVMAPSSEARLQQDLESQQGSGRVPGKTNGMMKAVGGAYSFARTTATTPPPGTPTQHRADREPVDYFGKANKRSVWTVTTKPFKEAHFATFPPELIIDCIKAGCPEGGIVLDPFMGAGTTALVAKSLGRHYIGCELNPEYIGIATRRLQSELGLFA